MDLLLKKHIRKFKTVDQIVEFFISIELENNIVSSIAHLVSDYCYELKNILLSKHNIPSKYDLTIIQVITDGCLPLAKKFRDILKIYKNRKIK